MEKKIKVLVAEDEAPTRNLLKAALDTHGYEVLLAENGREAVEIFFQGPTDAILMDINMPHLDGCQAIEQIRAMQGGKEIPIIVLTALDTPDWEEKCQKAGANLFLTKPFRAKDILHCLRTTLKQHSLKSTKTQKKETKSEAMAFKVRYQTNEGFLNCYMKNLMENRSFILTDHLLPLGSKFSFEITPPKGEKAFHVLGEVKWVNLYDGHKGMGVQFSFKNPEDKKRIEQYVIEMDGG